MQVQQGTIHIQKYRVDLLPINHRHSISQKMRTAHEKKYSMPTQPEILKRHTVARSRLFRADGLQLRFSNGEERIYEKLVRGNGFGAVLVIPMLDDQRVVMIREYAAGIHDYHLALPKGAIDKGETVLEAANRELKEEAEIGRASW